MLEDYRDRKVRYWRRVRNRVVNHAGDSLGNTSWLHPNLISWKWIQGRRAGYQGLWPCRVIRSRSWPKRWPWRRLSLHPAREAGEGLGKSQDVAVERNPGARLVKHDRCLVHRLLISWPPRRLVSESGVAPSPELHWARCSTLRGGQG